jgi:hypothetical protein
VREENSLVKVFRILEALFDGSMACPMVNEFVWILTVPYPLCYDDAGAAECNSLRSYRFNPAYAAANAHIIDFAVKLKADPKYTSPVQLSIIDAFSMIKPRLLFDEDGEVACLSHFMCRIAWDKNSSTIFTMGGKAVFDSLLHAILD